MALSDLLRLWERDPATAPNIASWQTQPARAARLEALPESLPAVLARALEQKGIRALYTHQSRTWELTRQGHNVILSTGTASGKSLAYNLPTITVLLENPNARAIYLFPTRALTQDQFAGLGKLLPPALLQSIHPAIYDGDTPTSNRSVIRKSSRIIFTNPDMLHTGILPHHTNWADFFRQLYVVIIDEVHTYRGVFGSHVANVIRRLQRLAHFYGASPRFVLTSATIANPLELGEKLIGAPLELVNEDGSARGERSFIIFNPPVIDSTLGLRKSALMESVRLANELLTHGVQGVIFARSRRTVEILLKYLRENNPQPGGEGTSPIRGYRSGYLPSERREIEKSLRDGSARLVVATNALELGIDIGGLGSAILVGYPGSIASVLQQAGRAGRGDAPAVSILIATPNPLDQFLAHHPEYFHARSPEQALVNPDHLLILLNHLRCALFELPFTRGEYFGRINVDEFLDFLAENNEAHRSDDRFFWMADDYPAAGVSLRSASPENIVLICDDGEKPRTIGEIDLSSAVWTVHPHAVYLHEAQQYFVQDLNLQTHTAALIPVALDYYTEALKETSIALVATTATAPVQGGEKAHGELQVSTQVTGFRKRMWIGGETIGYEALELPASELLTTGYWIRIDENTVGELAESGMWTNAPNDYGPEWPKIREKVRARDGYRCQLCGLPEGSRQHDVHHKIPFRQFVREAKSDPAYQARANQLDNLVTLCPECHKKAEQNVRMRSGMAGLSSVLSQLAPLFLMCDPGDLGVHFDPQANFTGGAATIVLYDLVPAGIGFSEKLFELHAELLFRAMELIQDCPCEDGCPSCVGPGGENGMGGKQETLELLIKLVDPAHHGTE